MHFPGVSHFYSGTDRQKQHPILMHPEGVHYHFWTGDFNPLLISKEPESKETVLKTLRHTTSHSVPATDIARDYSCSLGR